MATLNQMLGNGRTLKAGGKEYRLAPVTLETVNAMQDYYEMLPLERAKAELEKFGDMYEPKRKAKILDRARARVEAFRKVREGREKDQAKVDEAGEAFNRFMSSTEGTAYVLWLLVKDNDVSCEEAARIVDFTGLVDVQAMIDATSSAPPDPMDELDGDEKKTTGSNRIGRGFFAICLNGMASLPRRLVNCLRRK